jgi:hypothetical protein
MRFGGFRHPHTVVFYFYPHFFPMSEPELPEEAILHFLLEITPLIRWKIKTIKLLEKA